MPRSCSDNFYLQLIYEYLLHMGLENTATCFKVECGSNNYSVPEEICGVKRGDIHHLLQLFDEEDKDMFMKKFNASVPHKARASLEGKKLIADLFIFFAASSLLKDTSGQDGLWMKPLVDPLRSQFQNCDSSPSPIMHSIRVTHSHTSTNSETLERTEKCQCCGQNICNNTVPREQNILARPQCAETPGRKTPVYPCMGSLLEYLENECSDLWNDPYFESYFALPFTTCPQLHSKYKHIFQGSWPKSLRRRLWDFLVHHRQAASLPTMVRLLTSGEERVKNFAQ